MVCVKMSSEHDKAVLNSIFNPYLPLGEAAFEESLDDIDYIFEGEEDNEGAEMSKKFEIEGVMKSEAGNIDEAVRLFCEAIKTAPQRSSCYNNRAQAYRLKGNDEDALKDLQTAIELSKGKGKTKCQALCQRGLLYLKQGLDDLAKQDFQTAASLGSDFAKEQLVRMNPYAAMCNQMLNKMLKDLQSTDPESA